MNKITSNSLRGGLIVSCQPVTDGPLDEIVHIAAMAKAAQEGGANGLRIEGVENLRAVRAICEIPVVGIVKSDLKDSPVRITPSLEDVFELADAGADIIAFDATDRARPTPVNAILAAIHSAGCEAMADCSSYEDAKSVWNLGCAYIGTTLAGYVDNQPTPAGPDIEFLRKLVDAGMRVIAEGRYNTPELAADAIRLGAHAVTVGSAITRIEHITGWFSAAMMEARDAGALNK